MASRKGRASVETGSWGFAAATACFLAIGLVACKSADKSGAVARGKPPDYAEVAAGCNKRVEPLERLWCTTTIRIWWPAKGEVEQQAQVEGHLQYIRPSKFLLTFEKLGDTYAALGCNEERYWWIDAGEPKEAKVGEQARMTPQRIEQLGLPVHPLDLVDALGVTPLPSAAGVEEVKWSDDGRSLVVTVPARVGRRRIWMDPGTYEPSRVEVIGPDGAVAVSAELTKYERVEMPPGTGGAPRIATRMLASAQKEKLRVRLTLYDPKVSSSQPKPSAFDLSVLLRALKIKNVISLDNPPPAPAPVAGGG